MIYNIKYILNQGSSVLSKEYNNVLSKIKKCTNNIEKIKLYFINNKLAPQINQNLNQFKFKSRFEMILYSSEDIEMLNILKYYIFNQSPFIRDSKIIGLIKEIDEPFIKNMLLYNIYDAKELLEMEKLSMKDIYTLLIQSYWYESPDIIKSFIDDIQQYNNEDFDFSLFG
ncbi:hypothetical protein H8356DRAFT_1654688 [Neocallimastix lanati (nom. inval.)]|nr:hypothetical protein H8356DRAFT_1654688 [Neocallimastix sp. JGI-2020a]